VLAGYFFLATHFIVGRRRLSLTIIVLLLLGFSLALVGVLHKLTSNGRILWFRQVDSIEIVFGPFVNRNHFAGFLEMLIPLPLAVVLARGVDRDKWLLYGFIAVVLGAALVAASSRGGVIVLAAELLVLPLVAFKQREIVMRDAGYEMQDASRSRASRIAHLASSLKTLMVTGIIIVAILVGVVWIGAEPVVSRFSLTAETPELPLTDQLSRPAIWKNTLRMIKDNAVLGVGLGAYPIAYARYDDSPGTYSVEQAHNDYLQIVADAGLVGAVCLVAFIVFIVRAASRALSQTAPVERSLALGTIIACFGMGIHSLFDFNLQVTSNALLFLLLIALLVNLAGKSVVSSPLSVAESYGQRATDGGQEL
jgi:O-antigen ligase